MKKIHKNYEANLSKIQCAYQNGTLIGMFKYTQFSVSGRNDIIKTIRGTIFKANELFNNLALFVLINL